MVMTHAHITTHAQRSVSSKGRVETDRQTDGRTDRTDCITLPAKAVGRWVKIARSWSGMRLIAAVVLVDCRVVAVVAVCVVRM